MNELNLNYPRLSQWDTGSRPFRDLIKIALDEENNCENAGVIRCLAEIATAINTQNQHLQEIARETKAINQLPIQPKK